MTYDEEQKLQIKSKNDFIEDFAKLCEKHKATFNYTTDDDGIHIELDGDEVFTGFMYSWEDTLSNLRAAKIEA